MSPSPFSRQAVTSLISKGMAVLGSIGTVYLANQILGKDGFGGLTVALSLIGSVSIVASFGIPQLFVNIASKKLSENDEDAAHRVGTQLFGLLTIVLLVVLGGLWVWLDGIGHLLKYPQLREWQALILPVVAAGVYFEFFAGWYRVRLQMGRALVYQLGMKNGVLLGALAISMLLFPSQTAVMMAYGIASVSILIPPMCQTSFWRAYSWPTLTGSQWRFCGYTVVAGLLANVIFTADIYMLNFFQGPAAVASYQVAAKIAITLMIGSQILEPLLLSYLTRDIHSASPKAMWRSYHQYLGPSLAIWTLGMGVLLIWGQSILGVFGSYEAAYFPLVFIGVLKLWPLFFNIGNSVLVLRHLAGHNLRAAMIGCVTNIVLNAWLIPIYGIIGAIVASWVSFLAIYIDVLMVVWRKEGLNLFAHLLACVALTAVYFVAAVMHNSAITMTVIALTLVGTWWMYQRQYQRQSG